MELPCRLTFCEAQAYVDIQFWQRLRHLKLSEWKLDDQVVPIHGTFRTDISANACISDCSMVCFSQDAFDNSEMYHSTTPGSSFVTVRFPGLLKNFNVLPQLLDLDTKLSLIGVLCSELLIPLFFTEYVSHHEEEEAWRVANYTPFGMFTYVDAKSYLFYHREAFPSFALNSPIKISSSHTGGENSYMCERITGEILEHGRILLLEKPYSCNPFIFVVSEREHVTFHAFTPGNYSKLKDEGRNPVVCFFNFSPVPTSASWAARNIILCMRLALPSMTSFSFLALRPGGVASTWYVECTCEPLDALALAAALNTLRNSCSNSVFNSDIQPPADDLALLRPTGWRKKGVAVVDLSAMMDPALRADSDSRLNLELMRWRVLPSLELSSLAECKVLLLGMGTLGCNVSRNLLMWGVRHLTAVDRSVVSFSNLARQSLFSVSDASARRPKVEAAADALRAIIPTVDVRHMVMTVHMPGHRTDSAKEAETREDIERLIQLMREHDVVFLLTDSSEARWLPTIIAAAHGIPIINVALGFHQYVVMRHGVVSPSSAIDAGPLGPEGPSHVSHSSMGCYFCSSVVGPLDSVSGRALDEQCTVTRPGVSSIASAIAVELLAQIYQHPSRFRCPAYRGEHNGEATQGICCLGAIPQQIRGDVYRYGVSFYCAERSPYCTACSEPILLAYQNLGVDFLFRCINDPSIIEEISGVKALREQCSTELIDMELITSSESESF
ncbi:unnamed protein product [Phytomonas sp. EM1]|nr:unnamed protein product [Phytomonas sp. EM1]|eukprot:CCW64512.1 unnamed protein product [Phytomonas sp. isolate EM1]